MRASVNFAPTSSSLRKDDKRVLNRLLAQVPVSATQVALAVVGYADTQWCNRSVQRAGTTSRAVSVRGDNRGCNWTKLAKGRAKAVTTYLLAHGYRGTVPARPLDSTYYYLYGVDPSSGTCTPPVTDGLTDLAVINCSVTDTNTTLTVQAFAPG